MLHIEHETGWSDGKITWESEWNGLYLKELFKKENEHSGRNVDIYEREKTGPSGTNWYIKAKI